MKKLLLAAAASILFAGAASAADMAVKARPLPPPAPVMTWTGCYIGVNGGWAQSRVDSAWVPLGDGTAFGPASVASLNASSLARYTADSGTVGGQVGCNWQTGAFVWGVEGDYNWADLHTVRNALPLAGFGGVFTETQDYRVRGFGTVRGRLGVTGGSANWLLYVTGGVAFADFNYRDCLTAGANLTTCSISPASGGTGYNLADSSTFRAGWVVGAGGEYKFAPNWSVKGEYLYMGFNNYTTTSTFVNFPPGGFTGGTINHLHTNQNIQVARVGVNYHFGGPLVAKY